MPLNPALGDAYRNIVVTTGTASGGIPGTTTARAVDAQFNLDAGYGISLIADPLNNKVTVVNTGNGTGALTTITDINSNGNYYPIFTRGPTTTLTFTTGASDYVSATRPANVTELRITGTSNSPTGVTYALRTALAGLLPGETFQAVRVSDTATINFTVGTAAPINGIPQSSATYSTVNGYWTVVLTGSVGVAETYSSITVPTGVGDINPVTGTYQMDTMYLDQTTTPLTYNPSTGTLTFSNLVVNTLLVGPSANFTDFPGAQMVVSQAVTPTTHSYKMAVVGEAIADASDVNNWGVGLYGSGFTNGATRSAGVIGDGSVAASGDTGSAVGVRGYALDTHTGGLNIGLLGDAAGSTLGNYALYMTEGNIWSNVAQTWTLFDNTASALSIDTTGKTGIIVVKTSNGSEGVTMSGTLSVTGNVTVEGVTSTGATGTGRFVFDTSPAILGGTHTGLTSLGIRDTSAAFDLTVAATSSSALTAGRTLAIDVINASRTVKLAGNIDIAGNLVTANAFSTTGNFALTLTTTGTTTATLPSGTVTLAANNQTMFIGTTSVLINRASNNLALTGITSIDGNSATVTDGFYTTSSFNLGTTSIAVNRTSATQSLTGISIDGNSGTVTNGFYTTSAFNLGTTSILVNRASAAQSLTGITSIDGYAAGLTGGAIGSIPYQSAANTTLFVAGNITTTPQFVTSTGTGSVAQAPTLSSSTGSGNVVLSTNPTITSPTGGNSSSTADADATVDAAANTFYAYVQSASTTARTINISNLTAGRAITLYLRNTNIGAKTINITASTSTSGFAAVNMSKGDAGGTSVTAVTLSATSGTAMVTLFNANGTIAGAID